MAHNTARGTPARVLLLFALLAGGVTVAAWRDSLRRTELEHVAWPTAEIAVMGPEGAVDIVYKRELDRAANRETLRKEKIDEFRERFASPYVAAERGYVDAVIQPRDTRKKLIQALEMLETKRDKNPPKKHGNIPL